MSEDPLERLAAALVVEPVPLGEACLAVAAHLGHPDAIEEGLDELDRLAAQVAGAGDLAGVAHHLLGPGGFRGNRAQYYAPSNSLLPEVLRRRVGIPITLAVVLIDVARRVGVAAAGVGMPGHFLVGDGPRPRRWIDAFTGPEWIDEAAARDLMRASVGPQAPFVRSMLDATPDHQVVVRVLNNLRGIHRSSGEAGKLIRVHEMLSVTGMAEIIPSYRVEHAEALASVGRVAEAAALLLDLADELSSSNPDDAAVLRERAQVLRASLN